MATVVSADLAEVIGRHEVGLDAARPDAVARRRKTGQRTARENIEELCDAGTFVEYGPIVVAAQRRRRTIDDLIKNTPADGLVTGLATVNGNLFGADKARCVVMSYDYTVLAGTQGHQNHRKKDRMFQLARELRLPLVLFAEGGGGRPGDTDGGFHDFAIVSRFSEAERAGAAGRHHVGAMLCGQRVAAGMLRRGDCGDAIEYRNGRSGDDRGRRPGYLSSRGNRADGGAGAQRRRRYRGGRRVGGDPGRAANISRTSRAR